MSAGTEDRIINQIATDTDDDELLDPTQGAAATPIYKMYEGARIPVSKKAGNLWKSRRDASQRKLEQTGRIANWEEAIRYYKNDQRVNREGTAAKTRRDRGKSGRDSENVVFANTSALVPSIYAKNPTCEITANLRDNQEEGGQDDYMRRCATVSERLANTLSSRRAAPGINLKPKARKAVIMSILTNISYLEVGYTFREQSSEQALQDLDRIAQEMSVAKEAKEIERLEGELEALEEKVDFLNPSGPWVKFRHPKDVLTDPDALEADLSDARWIMIAEYLPTPYINAVYRMKQGEEWRSLYKPTHVVAGDGKGIEEEINSFSLLKGKTDYRSYGFVDEDSFNKATRTKVWKVWDKISRRVFMYSDEDWSWPIWVWDDPYNLDSYFTIYPLQFYTDPEDDVGQSEVMYYLDQQDGINEVNAELRKIRRKLMGTLFYNKNVIRDASVIDAYIKGESEIAVGVDSPPDANLQQALFALLPPSANFMQLFEVFRNTLNAAVQRVSSVQPVMQGQEFKTNTTNEAIETYNSTQQTRLDEKIDAVEDLIGQVLWAVIQMCLQFMPQEEVSAILGQDDGAHWKNLTPAEIRTGFSVRVVGGSSQKPTSKVKKQEALQMVQGLGQFAQAGQGVVIIKMLEVMSRAYDELVISEEDWDFLKHAIMQSIQNSNPQGAPAEGAPGAEGAAPQPTGDPTQDLAMIYDQLPPQAKLAIARATSNGAPIQEVLPRVLEMAQEQPAPTQTQQ
jgi:hypothetical protein